DGSEGYSDAVNDACNALLRFVNNEEKSGQLFLFEPDRLREIMGKSFRVQSEQVVEGTVLLSLGWLIDGYRPAGKDREGDSAFAADCRDMGEEERAEYAVGLEQLKKQHGEMALFSRKIVVYLEKVGNELVLDHIEDENGDPFSDPNGKMLGYMRACPFCGRYVSRAVGHGEEIVVALMGSPRAGKTSCLTAVASALSSGRYARMGLGLSPFEHDQAWASLESEMRWYDQGYRVEKTKTDQRAVPAYSMLVKVADKRRVLTFVDMPGEFWQSGSGLTQEFFMQYAGLFPNIDCIWFFVSKLSVYNIDLGEEGKKQEEWQLTLKEQAADDAKIIRESSAAKLSANLGLLREHMAARKRKIPPVAVILTKMELELGGEDAKHRRSFGLFPLGGGIPGADQQEMNAVFKPRPGTGGRGRRILDELEWFNRTNRVRAFLRLVNPGLLAAVEENCPYRSFVSMAAYGHAAAPRPGGEDMADDGYADEDRGSRYDKQDLLFQMDQEDLLPPEPEPAPGEEPLPPTPYRELFPLVWTLSIMGALEIEHRCVWRWRTALGHGRQDEELLILDQVRYGEPPMGKRVHELDLRTATLDVESNLLMVAARPDRELGLKVSVFEHRR
ncbi:MAG: hypothetical protein IK095_09710, partial [Oscillospiraceae bacterium]|nr:hypothetical protein [Oscillospiraceae bacterium]